MRVKPAAFCGLMAFTVAVALFNVALLSGWLGRVAGAAAILYLGN